MALTSTQRTVLDELATRIPDGVAWCVFGSTATVLHGVDGEPSDIDVLATEAGAETIRDAFLREFVGTGELGVSQVDEYRIHGEEVEVVYSIGTKDHQEPLVDLERVEFEQTDARGVPVLPIRPLAAAYWKIGRDETATELEERFDIESD